MTYPIRSEIQDIVVEFSELRTGWIEFTLVVGNERFETIFSDVNDPIAALRKWLEALSIGVYQCGFRYDTENEIITWSFTQTYWDKGIFRITDFHSQSESDSLVIAFAERKQIVKSLYLGFLRFFSSDKYKAEEWEIEYMWERLSKATKTTYDQLLNTLMELDRVVLENLFFKANPTFYVTYPEADNLADELNLFVQDTIDKANNNPNKIVRLETPMDWNIPEDYNYWTREKKLALIEECLATNVSGYNSEKPEVFQSKLIEQFLTEE